MNWSQISGAVDRVVFVLLGYAATHGLVAQEDVTFLQPLIVAGLAGVYGIFRNRASKTLERAASIQGATVIAPDNLANKTQNVIRNSQVEVISK